MAEVKAYLKGRKTFIIAALMIALGILQGNTELILEGIVAITIRLGIAS